MNLVNGLSQLEFPIGILEVMPSWVLILLGTQIFSWSHTHIIIDHFILNCYFKLPSTFVHLHVYEGRHGNLHVMVSVLDSKTSGLGLIPDWDTVLCSWARHLTLTVPQPLHPGRYRKSPCISHTHTHVDKPQNQFGGTKLC